MELAIAEKPEVAKAMARAISKNVERKDGYYICSDIDVIITYAIGNLLELADPEYFNKDFAKWNREHLPMKWPVKFIPNPKTSKQLKIIGSLLEKCDSLACATDIDSAGSHIFYSIIEHFSKMNLPMKRVFINDNNLIKKAWDERRDAPEAYYDALSEKARTIADQVTGYNLTRALTTQCQYQGWQKLLTVGRVSGCIIGICIRRQLEINNFVPVDYYNISININIGNDILKGVKYEPCEEDPINEDNKIINKSFAENLAVGLSDIELTLNSMETSQKETSRPLPHDLGSLQGAADKLFSYSLDKVLKISQSLRDKGLCTYNRTDSQYLSDEAFYDAPDLLNALGTVEMFRPIINLCTVDESRKSRCFNSKRVSAHHGICPSGNPSQIVGLTEEEFNIYFLIVRNYVIQFMEPEIKETMSLEFSGVINNKTAYFKTSKTRQIQAGWQILFEKEKKKEQDSDAVKEENFDINISLLKEGAAYSVNEATVADLTTNPPALYTIVTLLNAMRNSANLVEDEEIKKMLLTKDEGKKDRGGIGTAATRTPILTELFRKQQLKKIKKQIQITDSAIVLYNALPESVTSPTTTAIWADQQSQIADGILSVEKFTDGVERFVTDAVNEIKKGIDIPEKYIKDKRLERCPCCKEKSAEQREGKTGTYWLCQPCSKTFSDYEDAPFDKNTMKRHTEICPKCNGEAEKLNGQYGDYWKCNACGNLPDLNGNPYFESCPNCRSPLKIIHSKKAKGKKKNDPFISCSSYPDCNYKKSITQ